MPRHLAKEERIDFLAMYSASCQHLNVWNESSYCFIITYHYSLHWGGEYCWNESAPHSGEWYYLVFPQKKIVGLW